jgi:hypothetical protein
MRKVADKALGPFKGKGNGCLSCGTTLGIGRRRYCSVECRQRLRYKLNVRTGLLRALNTRYATFYFTDVFIVLDILPQDRREIFSFIFPRSPERTPADDFSRMADLLGNAWWAEKRRTRKSYLASRHLFSRAKRNNCSPQTVMPTETRTPRIKSNALIHLKLDRFSLNTPELKTVLKKAYRQQAKRHHPDVGGDGAAFRKIHQAYEELLSWSENPSFIRRRGFPDKWFYDGHRNRWVQPTPVQPARATT